MQETDWIFKLKQEIPLFLERLQSKLTPGFFHYALSGDLSDEKKHWGLGNTVFATKSYFTLGILDALPKQTRKAMIDFILSFQYTDGTLSDPLVARLAYWRDKFAAIKHGDSQNFFHTQTVRAQTRQAVSALQLLGVHESVYPKDLPTTSEEVQRYLQKLDWTKPWHAGSHFSHLLFFLTLSQQENKTILIDSAIAWVNAIQDKQTGCWFRGAPSLQQKINGAMKILTGFKVAQKMHIRYPEKLIDFALSVKNDQHACDHFNVIYVLKYAGEASHSKYRHQEIQDFALERLGLYQKYYWKEFGGFSFFLGKSNEIYYNARITKGLAEPDIHGTTLFLWGIALIAQLLGIEKELGFKEFVT